MSLFPEEEIHELRVSEAQLKRQVYDQDNQLAALKRVSEQQLAELTELRAAQFDMARRLLEEHNCAVDQRARSLIALDRMCQETLAQLHALTHTCQGAIECMRICQATVSHLAGVAPAPNAMAHRRPVVVASKRRAVAAAAAAAHKD